MLFDVDGSGEREYRASVYTLMLYEQEFGSSLIKDVFGRIEVGDDADLVTAEFVRKRLAAAMPDGKRLPKATSDLVDRAFPAPRARYLDFTKDNWEADVRALWAMAKTADEAAGGGTTPPFKQWYARLGAVNLSEVSKAVVEEAQRGLFRAASA